MAYEKQNFIDGQVLKAEHLNNMENELARQKAWSELGESPTGGDTLTWDGNTEGLENVDVLYKVSDAVPKKEDFANGCTSVFGMEKAEWDSEYAQSFFGDDGFMFAEIFVVVPVDNYDMDGLIFPEQGIYFAKVDGLYASSLTIPGFTGFPSVNKVPEKYLPEHLQFGETPTGGDTLTWYGDTEGRAVIDVTGESSGFIHVSDVVLTVSDLENSVTLGYDTGASEAESGVSESNDSGYIVGAEMAFLVIPTDNFSGEVMGTAFTAEKKGLYFMSIPGFGTLYSLTINGFTNFPVVKKINAKYLPETAEEKITLYIKPDETPTYLYYDADCTQKLPVYTLGECIDKGVNLLYIKSEDAKAFATILNATIPSAIYADSYGTVIFSKSVSDGTLEVGTAYTAEYTASE